MCENNSALVNHIKIVHASDWSKTLVFPEWENHSVS